MNRAPGSVLCRAHVSRGELFAIGALLLASLQISSLQWQLPLDRLFDSWLDSYGSAALSSAAEWVAPVVSGCLCLLVVLTICAGGWRRPRGVIAVALMVATGAAINELLKTGLERSRPSAPLLAFTGNSLPSGHIMNTTIFAVAAYLLARHAGWRPCMRHAVAAVGISCVVLTIAARLIRGSHWLSDVPASVGLGLAWAFGATGVARLLGQRGIAVAIAAYLGLYTLFYLEPAVRIRLVSAADSGRHAPLPADSIPPESLQTPMTLLEPRRQTAARSPAARWHNQ
jgi:membrane-associated phospholipid phosphatase